MTLTKPDSTVNQLCDGEGNKVVIGHPMGLIDLDVGSKCAGDSVNIQHVTVGRTARRLMAGVTYYIA